MKTLKSFMDQYKFDPKRNMFIGVERECHLLDPNGKIVPIAPKVLKELSSRNGQFAFELSACQLEWRVGPCKDILAVEEELEKSEATLRCAEKRLNFRRSFIEVAPHDMPLDVYPDPSGRYQEITRNMSEEVLRAACQVIATHVHIGMPDYKTALRKYNQAVPLWSQLCKMGDHSNGERMKIYSIMAPHYEPPLYESWQDFYEKAKREDFVNDPRSCWTLIRLSKHGTIEFRMFGATKDIGEIIQWTEFCLSICQ